MKYISLQKLFQLQPKAHNGIPRLRVVCADWKRENIRPMSVIDDLVLRQEDQPQIRHSSCQIAQSIVVRITLFIMTWCESA